MMDSVIQQVIGKVGTRPGQGGMLEQIDKLLRRQQRIELFKMLEQIDKKEVRGFPVVLYKSIPQKGKKNPALLRYSLPKWQGYDEVYWQALGDYVILALHRVKDVNYDADRGKIKVEYFAKTAGPIRSPENIREIIKGIAYLMDTEALPTDFTRFRRMDERRGSLGEMSKEQAALIAAAFKFLSPI
jgi:hypothetical protein